MHKDTEKFLEKILEQSRRNGGVIEDLQGGNDDNHIDWLFDAGYLRSTHEPIRTFEGTVYMNTMPTEKGYEWERERLETGTERSRAIETRLQEKLAATKAMAQTVNKLDGEARDIGKAWCGSSMGNHAKVYYEGLEPVPAEAYWDTEWGMQNSSGMSRGQGAWRTYTVDEVKNAIYSRGGTTEAEMNGYADQLFRTLDRMLASCQRSTAMVYPEAVQGPVPGSIPEDPLALYDDNRNGRITCKEARKHGIAPVMRSHPAYKYMRDGNNDGQVC